MDIIKKGHGFVLIDDSGKPLNMYPSREAALKDMLFMQYQGMAQPNPNTATAFQPQTGIPTMQSAPVSISAPPGYMAPQTMPQPQTPPQMIQNEPTLEELHRRALARTEEVPLLTQMYSPNSAALAASQTSGGMPGTKSGLSLNFALPKSIVSAAEEQVSRKKDITERTKELPGVKKGAHMEHFPTDEQLDIGLLPSPAERRAKIEEARAARAMGIDPSTPQTEDIMPDVGRSGEHRRAQWTDADMTDERAANILRKAGIGPKMEPGPTGAEAWAETDRKIER